MQYTFSAFCHDFMLFVIEMWHSKYVRNYLVNESVLARIKWKCSLIAGEIFGVINSLFFPLPCCWCSVAKSLRPQGLQHTSLLCPPLSPAICSNSCPLSVMLSNHLIFCHPLILLLSIFPSIRVFSKVSALCIRWPKYCIGWPKYWSFNFNNSPPCNE